MLEEVEKVAPVASSVTTCPTVKLSVFPDGTAVITASTAGVVCTMVASNAVVELKPGLPLMDVALKLSDVVPLAPKPTVITLPV